MFCLFVCFDIFCGELGLNFTPGLLVLVSVFCHPRCMELLRDEIFPAAGLHFVFVILFISSSVFSKTFFCLYCCWQCLITIETNKQTLPFIPISVWSKRNCNSNCMHGLSLLRLYSCRPTIFVTWSNGIAAMWCLLFLAKQAQTPNTIFVSQKS